MSMHKAIRRVPTYLAVIAFLLMRLASINGAVACFGADGHIALEGAHVATSGEASHSLASDMGQVVAQASTPRLVAQQVHSSVCLDDGDTSCVDVSAPHDSEQHVIGASELHLPDIAGAVLAPIDFAITPITEISYAANLIRGPPAAGTFLLHLRSVILLI